MKDVQHGKIIFSCDVGGPRCDEVLETRTADFNEALAKLREEGWKAYKDDDEGEWNHRCPSCPAQVHRGRLHQSG